MKIQLSKECNALIYLQRKVLISLILTALSFAGFAQQIEMNNWKFKTGNNTEWASATFDDSSWKPIASGKSWEAQGYIDYDGYAWYRVKFFLPSGIKKDPQFKGIIKIALGKIDDCDHTFLNGKLIGQNAKLTATSTESPASDLSKSETAYTIDRNYILSANDPRLNWDKENVISIRVYDGRGDGGMWNGRTYVGIAELSDYLTIEHPTGLLKVDSDGKVRATIKIKFKLPVSELKGKIKVVAESGVDPNAGSTQSFDVTMKDTVVRFCFDADKSKWIKATFTYTESKTGKSVSMVWSNLIVSNWGTRNFDSLWNAKRETRLKSSDPGLWQPVSYKAEAPVSGITLSNTGLFKPAMERNINYLLHSFSVNHMLYPFLQRAGKPVLPDNIPQIGFWDTDLRGSNAGRFLMGAGNTLRWMENAPLRDSLNKLIDGIDACRESNGYILPYPHILDSIRNEEPGYARAWLTHGLIEAGIAGNKKAYDLLRGHADYFNQWNELQTKLIYWWYNGHQGHIASTRTYFTPIGKPEDLLVAEKYYVCDWWLDDLSARKTEAIWQYPLSSPHCYLLTGIEPYLDHYRATGDKKYLDACMGGWELYHNYWEHVGGSIAICESQFYPPKSYYLTAKDHTGEACGSAFWIKLNQRFQQLYPDDEKYTNEIEKSIYNIILACQMHDGKIRYHSLMEGKNEAESSSANTCCEAQATRILGSLPEYIYSTASDGVYINLYEPSSIKFLVAGTPATVTMESKFPYNPHVALKLALAKPTKMKIRVRVPTWAAGTMAITVNGKQYVTGNPGSYAVLDRTWTNGDVINFDLPIDLHVTRYAGADTIKDHERYAVEYGPILLTAVANQLPVFIKQNPKQIKQWLNRKSEETLDFTVKGENKIMFMPYFEVKEKMTFTSFPVME